MFNRGDNILVYLKKMFWPTFSKTSGFFLLNVMND